MFGFLRRKKTPDPATVAEAATLPAQAGAAEPASADVAPAAPVAPAASSATATLDDRDLARDAATTDVAGPSIRAGDDAASESPVARRAAASLGDTSAADRVAPGTPAGDAPRGDAGSAPESQIEADATPAPAPRWYQRWFGAPAPVAVPPAPGVAGEAPAEGAAVGRDEGDEARDRRIAQEQAAAQRDAVERAAAERAAAERAAAERAAAERAAAERAGAERAAAERAAAERAAAERDAAERAAAAATEREAAERLEEARTAADAHAATTEPDAPLPGSDPRASEERRSWMSRLRQGLGKTRSNIAGLFGVVRIDEALFEDLETALLSSDVGVDATMTLIGALRARVKQERLADGEQVRAALRRLVADMLRPLEQPMDIDRAQPLVMMIAGVNGAGKTTSIGKLAHHLQREGKSILLAAGDTFRAAAREQLAEWGARNDVQVIAQQGGDPAAVAFDAVSAGLARHTGVVMVDTAGRLPTQTHLMQELKKIRRVIAKAMPEAPHEVLLVLDGNTGQNILAQVKAFDDAVSLTGLVVTKLDGTAKGGALVALAHTRRERPIPIYFIGVGETLQDLQAFSADEFATAMIG